MSEVPLYRKESHRPAASGRESGWTGYSPHGRLLYIYIYVYQSTEYTKRLTNRKPPRIGRGFTALRRYDGRAVGGGAHSTASGRLPERANQASRQVLPGITGRESAIAISPQNRTKLFPNRPLLDKI